jgi:hypothetical protein
MGLPLKVEIGRMKELQDVARINALILEIEKSIGALEAEK